MDKPRKIKKSLISDEQRWNNVCNAIAQDVLLEENDSSGFAPFGELLSRIHHTLAEARKSDDYRDFVADKPQTEGKHISPKKAN